MTTTKANFAFTMKEAIGCVSFRITASGGYITGYNATTNRLVKTQVGQAADVCMAVHQLPVLSAFLF
jgi:hypothetical protein